MIRLRDLFKIFFISIIFFTACNTSDKSDKNLTVEQPIPLTKDVFFANVGDMITDIALLDTEGKIHKISDIKNKYILIDFWATWCFSCINNLNSLASIYKKGGEFEIYSISTDTDIEKLRNVIMSKPKWDWIHINDPGLSEEIKKDSLLMVFPQYILIDNTGKVIYTTKSFTDLERKLNEL